MSLVLFFKTTICVPTIYNKTHEKETKPIIIQNKEVVFRTNYLQATVSLMWCTQIFHSNIMFIFLYFRINATQPNQNPIPLDKTNAICFYSFSFEKPYLKFKHKTTKQKHIPLNKTNAIFFYAFSFENQILNLVNIFSILNMFYKCVFGKSISLESRTKTSKKDPKKLKNHSKNKTPYSKFRVCFSYKNHMFHEGLFGKSHSVQECERM